MPDGALTPTAPPRVEPLDADTIADLQASALLLLRHASTLTERSLGAAWDPRPPQGVTLPPEPPAPSLSAFLADVTALLSRPPAELATAPADAARLFGAVDYLAGLAEPATADTIALTTAFVDPSLAQLPQPFHRLGPCGAMLRRFFSWLRYAAVGTLFLTMVLTIHVVWGQSVIGTVKDLRQEQAVLWTQVTAAEASAAQVQPGVTGWVPYCERRSATGGRLDARQAGLCAGVDDLGLRMSLAYGQLAVWNHITDTLLIVLSPVRWLGLGVDPHWGDQAVQADQWASTEQRTAVMLTALTVYVMPVLVGLLGAFAYVFRRINTKVEEYSLEARDRMQAILRIFLGVLLGGLVGLFFQPEGVELSGIRLSIAALAFLVGYSVQVVFEAMDSLISFALGVLRAKTTADR